MRDIIAKCGHVTRRLKRDEPLTGKVLDFAISVIDENRKGANDDLLKGMADKLTAGRRLSDYELHILLDVLLLHKRLEGQATGGVRHPLDISLE